MDNENTVSKTTAEQPAMAERTRSGCCYRPNVDILEQGDELLVVADVPGARSDTIDVKFEDGMLEIQAAVEPRECDGHTCLLREYDVGDYYRSFQVSEAIDAGKISAQYADGVLTLHLPKAEALKPRKIAVAAK
jgi:HSP20 family protein